MVFLRDYLDDWELIQILCVAPPPAAARAFCTVGDIALYGRTRDERDDLLGAARSSRHARTLVSCVKKKLQPLVDDFDIPQARCQSSI